jgi:hypothetical protein
LREPLRLSLLFYFLLLRRASLLLVSLLRRALLLFVVSSHMSAPRTVAWSCFGSSDAPASSVAAARCTAASCAVAPGGSAAYSAMSSCYPELLARSSPCSASAPASAAAVVCFWTGPSHPPAAASFAVAAAVTALALHPAQLAGSRFASRFSLLRLSLLLFVVP